MDSLLWSLRSHFQRETEAQSFELLRVLRIGEKDPVSLALCSSSAGLAEPLPLTSHCYQSVSPVPPTPPQTRQAAAALRLLAQEPQILLSKRIQRCCLGTMATGQTFLSSLSRVCFLGGTVAWRWGLAKGSTPVPPGFQLQQMGGS